MVNIRWFGHSMWKIWTDDVSIITDPFADIGYPLPQNECADIVLISHDHFDHNNYKLIKGNPRIIREPGEHSIQGINFLLLPVWHDDCRGRKRGVNHLMKFRLADLNFLHCGDLGHLPEEDVLVQLGKVDVIFLPVGGFFTIDAKTACQIVQKLSPRLIFPMHYSTPAIDFPIDPVDNFLKIAGKYSKIDEHTFTISEADLKQKKIVVLNYE